MTTYYTTPDYRKINGSFREAVCSERFRKSALTTAALAEDVLIDFAKVPHVLVAGSTGSGKSVMLHNILASLLLRNTPSSAQFLIIDPKMVEFEYFYHDIPVLYCPIVTEPSDAINALERASVEMMNRYDINRQRGHRFWEGRQLYIIIDEIADLISAGGKRLEKIIEKIARLGRGAGVHLIVATQHPTADVLSRQITTNLDARICLHVKDSSASRLVLGHSGGEYLRGMGDAILQVNGADTRFQGAYISDEDLEVFSRSWVVETKPDPEPIRVKATKESYLNFFNKLKTA